jgi:LysM repeat protein
MFRSAGFKRRIKRSTMERATGQAGKAAKGSLRMTREAKIGLLTGLGVIVLIGVLLSEYLGGPAGVGPGGTMTASSSRMAPLPIAQAYRDQQLKPIGVPGMARPAESTEVAVTPPAEPVQVASAAPSTQVVPAAPLMNQFGALPRAMASDSPAASQPEADATPMPTTPVVSPAITPIKDGHVLAYASGSNNLPAGVPSFQLQESQPVSLNSASAATGSPTAKSAVSSQDYVIASGDTLRKIAKKFYNSSKPEDVQKIVSANPATLKSATTMLVVGKKLTIPSAPPVPAQVATALRPSDDGATAQPKTATALVIRTPGASRTTADPHKLSSKPDAAKSYVVQSGDTPEKIARKFGGSLDFARQLMAVNKIKDASKLQIGMKLTLPAK